MFDRDNHSNVKLKRLNKIFVTARQQTFYISQFHIPISKKAEQK